jgi:unspecific monooxygenase
MLHAPPYVPPVPTPPDAPLGFGAFLRTIRGNAIGMWPRAAYEQPAFEQRFLLHRFVLLNAPDAIHRVLIDNAENYRRSPASVRILRPITGQGLLLSEGADWRLQRRTTAPALAPRVIPLLCRHIAACADTGVARLAALAKTGPVDMLAETQLLALDIAARSMFSLEATRFGAAMRAQLEEFARHYAQPRLFDLLLPASIRSPRDFGRARFQRRWLGMIDAILDARLAEPEAAEPRDLLDLLRGARDPETGAGFDRARLRDQVATLIVAGHETTAVTLFWSLVLLARAPAEQARIAAEVAGRDLGPDAAGTALAQLPVTRAVVSESLRLYPPAFTIARQTISNDRVGDQTIAAGGVVLIAPWVLHRHRALWEHPDAFDPERFMPGAPTPARFAYMPFGAGPRVCVGAQFALAEAVLVLARLVQAFRIDLPNPRPVLPAAVVTTQPDHRPGFVLTPR